MKADRRLLKDLAYHRLKERILAGQDEPGSFLSERMLSSQLGMSKTPIRAALERLESEGFVSVSPQQGIVIREPSLREIADQFELRFALESYLFRSLAGRLRKDQIGRIRGNLEAQRGAAEAGDLETSIRLDGEFHLLYSEFQGNQEISAVLLRLREKILWVISLVFLQDRRRMRPNWEEHGKIADAVIEGKGEEAVRLLELHFEYGKRSLLDRV